MMFALHGQHPLRKHHEDFASKGNTRIEEKCTVLARESTLAGNRSTTDEPKNVPD